jgi:uncharacterized phage protein (TIGR01671 family)
MENRIIKFRGWHTTQKKMYSAEEMAADQLTLLLIGEFINVSGRSLGESVIYPPNKFIPLQYTGLHDKNGNEIYEGDIVRVDDREIGAPKICIGEVYWCTDYTLECNPCFAGWGKGGHFQLSPNVEILGNRYENPELLEDKNG